MIMISVEASERTGQIGDPEITDLHRRVANLIRIGTIAEADHAASRARVAIGPLLTDWRPWITQRAGQDVAHWVPEVGEQVVVLSPSGDLAQGVILPALHQAAVPDPASRPDIRRERYADGTDIAYDRAAHRLTIDLSAAGGTVEIRCGPDAFIRLDPGRLVLKAPWIDLNGEG